jgi:outer membrane protein assembly factor BamB
MKKAAWLVAASILTLGLSGAALAGGPGDWPQFRGPDGLGIAPGAGKPPVRFGPQSNLLWKTALPPGNSSPVIWGERIFLTGFDKQKQALETFCLDRETGQIRWRRAAPPVAKIETSLHPTNGPATPTPVTDGQRVYAYFGSYGLLAYDFDGKEQWRRPLAPPDSMFGSGSSPILAGDLLLLTCQGKGACLLAVEARTGATVWKQDHLRFGAGYSTPVLRQNGRTTEVVLAQPRGLAAYNLKDGAEIWWTGGLMGGGIPSPALGDSLVFAVAYFPGGEPDDRMKFPSFDDMLKKFDANKDGLLGQKEVPADFLFYDRGSPDPKDNITMEDLFPMMDRNRDGQISRQEWDQAVAELGKMESALVAVRPGGKGELTGDRVVWRERRALPEVPSPLYYQGRLYLVKNGGLVSCFDATTGKLLYRQRLGTGGFFYASPVAADGRVYAASYNGVVVVFQAGDRCQVLARNNLGENIVATPALADGRLYVRTEGNLYAFAGPLAAEPLGDRCPRSCLHCFQPWYTTARTSNGSFRGGR